MMELLQKLQLLEENIKILHEIKDHVSLQELKTNKRFEWEIRYGLLESIQIVIDITCKLASKYNLGNPKNYKECILLLQQHHYISTEISTKLISMVGLRNLLVHEYVKIDDEKLYQFLYDLGDFIGFVQEIRDYL